MDSARFEHLIKLGDSGRLEDVIRESQAMLAETADAHEKGSLLAGMCMAYGSLGRLKDARQTLNQMKQLELSHAGIRLNADYFESVLLNQEGQYEASLSAFATTLDRNHDLLKDSEYRYLYEEIQCRRALTLIGLSRYKDALPLLKEAVGFSFDQPLAEQQVRFALGVCLEDANDTEAAKREFIHVVAFGLKNDVEEKTLWRLGILFYKAGALAQAKQHLETMLRDFPSGSAIPRKKVYKALSQTYHYLGDKANEKLYQGLASKS
jgi:tetratricopeptide (TPR) repeat protein